MRNMTHIEQDFDTAEFRAVMSVYWAKIAAF